MANSELKTKTVSSLFWSFSDKFGHQFINLAGSIVLMAIVEKSDFGILATLTVFTAFSSVLIDSGFVRALINRKNVSDKEYSAVFYFNVVLSVFLYGVLFFASPHLARFFNEPLIEPVSRWVFLSLVLNAFGLVQQTLLIKAADFRGLTRINIPAVFVAAAIAVAMALCGYGLQALIAQQLVYPLLRTILLWRYSGWRPAAHFGPRTLRPFMGLSNKLILASLVGTLFNNIYPNIIAFFYPNSMNRVADYAQANKYQEIPFGMISNTFRSVSMLILSEINRETERLRRVVSKLMKTISFLSFIVGLFMILVAQSVFELIWQEKWLSAVPYFRILCVAGMLSPFTFILNELFIARERADFFLNVEVAKRVILVALIALLFRFGIEGLAWSWVAYTFITLLVSLLLSSKLIGYSPLDFAKDMLPYLSAAVASTLLGYWATARISDNLVFILLNGILAGGGYFALCRLLKLEMTKEIGAWFSSKKQPRR